MPRIALPYRQVTVFIHLLNPLFMNRMLLIVLTLCCLAGSRMGAQAQPGFLHVSGTDIVDGNNNPVLLRGMGLGGWMLMEGYMMTTASVANTQHEFRSKLNSLIGVANTDAFFQAWLANHVTKRDIDSLKAWGFNSVRLPMHYNLFTLPIQQEPVAGQNTWINTGFQLTDSLLSWCEQNEMYLILDLHAAPGGQGMDAAISDYNPALPSLWESTANQDKTVALWARLADRYKDEPWIGGYDLLNEVNWNLPGNTALRNLYGRITTAIRQVDTNHIIYIEGNWFANDFTGLTPAWDPNMVYSFHRYWAFNTQNTIQSYLDMRESTQRPLWMGEAGENSNVWFRDCIRLLERHNIGWAWWPMKKIDNITNHYSITKNTGYQRIVDFWGGQATQPSVSSATAAMMQLATDANTANCRIQPDVVHALSELILTDEPKAYRTQQIPGVVYAVDFDMGNNGIAYQDAGFANYRVSTGNYTAWNNGWTYRNDGVDIEVSQDPLNARGCNVGWIDNNEWLQYDVDVAAAGSYSVQLNVASNGSGGTVHLELDGADLFQPASFSGTGGWQTWQNVNLPNVVLSQGRHKLRLYVNQGGFNLGSIRFVQSGTPTQISTAFMSAVTVDEFHVDVNLNKPMVAPATAPGGFQLFMGGNEIPITGIQLNPANDRLIRLTTGQELRAGTFITVSYGGTAAVATDGSALQAFSSKQVINTLIFAQPVPGKIQAESYFLQEGIELENTTDIGSGQNIGYCDAGDLWLYKVRVQTFGRYQVISRVSSDEATGAFVIQWLDPATQAFVSLDTVNVPDTGGWQNWTDVVSSVVLPAGVHTLRVLVTGPKFNINWLDFTFTTSIDKSLKNSGISFFPNPASGEVSFRFENVDGRSLRFSVTNLAGQVVKTHELNVLRQEERLDLTGLAPGLYLLQVEDENGRKWSEKLVLKP